MERNAAPIAQRIHEVMRRLVHHHMRLLSLPNLDIDLTRAQTATLVQIGREGSVSMGALAEGLGIAPGSLTGVIDRLIEKGLVLRERSTADRRKVMVALSPQGTEGYSRFQEAASRFSDAMLALLTGEESRTLLQLMEKLVEGLERRERAGQASRSDGNH